MTHRDTDSTICYVAAIMSEHQSQLFQRQRLQDRLSEQGLPAETADRFLTLAGRAVDTLGFGSEDELLFASAPGRTELGGNHTDHNLGRVVAAGVQLDTIALVRRRADRRVRFLSEGFPAVELSVDQSDPDSAEQGTTTALVRGVLAEFAARGLEVGGFDAVASSAVLAGSGLSSSASFEVLVGAIVSGLFNRGEVHATVLAQIGQIAENRYFGKPSGLMDQVACATGGAVWIDFADPTEPAVAQVQASFESCGYTLCVVDTGGDHANLTDQYAAIPREMRAVAGAFGASNLRGVDEAAFLGRIPKLRDTYGDRAVNRALHFFAENRRVDEMLEALQGNDMGRYLRVMHQSGHSSVAYLQNGAPQGAPARQAVVTALALSEQVFSTLGLEPGVDATARVHGGGFAGTIQALLPTDAYERYVEQMNSYLGTHAVTRLSIRNAGAVAFAL